MVSRAGQLFFGQAAPHTVKVGVHRVADSPGDTSSVLPLVSDGRKMVAQVNTGRQFRASLRTGETKGNLPGHLVHLFRVRIITHGVFGYFYRGFPVRSRLVCCGIVIATRHDGSAHHQQQQSRCILTQCPNNVLHNHVVLKVNNLFLSVPRISRRHRSNCIC